MPTATELPSEFAGMDRFVARKAIVAKFDELGLLVEVKDHDLVAPYGDRSGVIIEPMLTDQWYVRVEKLAGPAVDAVKDGQIEFVPKQYENLIFFLDERYSRLVYFSSIMVGTSYSCLV